MTKMLFTLCAGKLPATVSSAKRFYALISFITVCHFIIRGLLYPGAPTDDAEQLLFSQVFDWGYGVTNPPLYTWMVIAIQQVVGIETWSVSLIKFSAYFLIFHFMYLLGLRILKDHQLAVLASLSLFLLYYIAWDSVLTYSHSILATVFILATLVSLLRVFDHMDMTSYGLFGLMVGFGLLSKYTYALFFLSLILSTVTCSTYRRIILNKKVLISLIIILIIIAPHALWLKENSNIIGGTISQKFEVHQVGTFLGSRLQGLGSMLSSVINFVSPLWIVLLAIFWKPILARLKFKKATTLNTRYLLNYLFVALGLIITLILISGVSKVRAHYMFLLIPFPIAFFSWMAPQLKLYSKRVQFSIGIMIIISFLALGGMIVKYITEPQSCNRCQLLVPYKDIAQKIRNIGFQNGIIIGYYFPHDLAGNLRTSFPDTPIVSTKHPSIVSKKKRLPGQCLIMWMPPPEGVMDGHGMTQYLNTFYNAKLGYDAYKGRTFTFVFDRTNNRINRLHYIFFPNGVGTCR
jgi:hypothetical protein